MDETQMTHNTIALYLLIAVLCAGDASGARVKLATGTSYKITQVTSGSFDHKWPSTNNNGDIVWSQQASGLWQVYVLKNGSTSPSPIPVPSTSHNREYPDIDDTGSVIYLEDGQGAGPGLAVVQNTGGVESTIEFSSGNPPGCTEPPAGSATCTSWRAAGQHFGVAGNSTTISYHDFCSPSCTRNFDVSGIGQLSGSWSGADYPDINGQGTFVYTAGGSIFSASTAAPNSATLVASGSNPRIADGSTNPEIVYLAAGNVVSTVGGVVATGIWTDIGASGTIVFEQVVSGFSQVFLATPILPTGLSTASGDQQTGSIGSILAQRLTIKTMTAAGQPAPGVNISFSITQQPTGNTGESLNPTTATTASDGTASSQLTLGDMPGQYQVTALCVGETCSPSSVTFTELAVCPTGQTCTPTLSLTADNTTPVPSVLTNPSVSESLSTISVTANAVTFSPSSNITIDFSAQPVNLQTGAGHKHLNLTSSSLYLGVFQPSSCTITTDNTGQGQCTVDYSVSNAAGAFSLNGSYALGGQTITGSTQIDVQLGLAELGSSSFYRLTGNPPNGGLKACPSAKSDHTATHYGTSALLSAMPLVGQQYSQMKPGRTLGLNDMSLPLGGIFDICNNWTYPHQYHQSGNSVDIDHSDNGSSCPSPYNGSSCVSPKILGTVMTKNGLSRVTEGSLIHYQIIGTTDSPFLTEEMEASIRAFQVSTPIPAVLGTEVLASVSEFGDILVYKYGVRNISTSTGTISGLDIDISRAPGTVEISAAGLTQGTGSLVGVGYPSLVRVGAAGIEVVPVGLSGATGWMSGLSVSGNAYWTATDDQYEILPGTIQQNFEITSRGLPAIRDFTVEPYLDLDRLPPLDVSDEDSGGWNVQNLGILKRLIKFSGRTIAPTAPPADFHPTAFLSTIHSYKDEAVRLGWMTDPQLSSRLDSSFENAGQFLKAGATESARQVLLALLTELTRSRGKVSSECMALLEVNTRYLLSNLGR